MSLTLISVCLKLTWAILVEEALIPKSWDDKLLVGGLFAVPHTKGRQRLIFDRRVLNVRERKLDWVSLRRGVMFTKMILAEGYCLRGSGDDIDTYYFQLGHEPNWYHRNCFGRRITGLAAQRLGGDPSKVYRMALKSGWYG